MKSYPGKQSVPIVLLAIVTAGLLMLTAACASAQESARAPGRVMAQQATKNQSNWTTADHSKYAALQKTFKSGEEITQACISCHSEAAEQFKQTIHWKWIGFADEHGKKLGKAGDSVNNFCISTNNMEDKKCLECHTGWNGMQGGINCLKCHSGKKLNWSEAFADYHAFAESDDPAKKQAAGEIQAKIQAAAHDVGPPTRRNCGECHFKGGGGDGVKHGDLDSSLIKPNKALDVHMGTDNQDFQCTRCHTTVGHHVAGRIYSRPAFQKRQSLIENDLTAKISCESCHGRTPHEPGHKANDHTDKVACQACHIPEFARSMPTKVFWDWSAAGKLKDGKPYKEKGPLGTIDYATIKGAMVWGKNVRPEYAWFNGAMKTLTVKDTIDPTQVVAITEPIGSPQDSHSRIFPFKVNRGKQPYDKVHKNMLAPMVSGEDGYWATLDWQRAISAGMQAMNLPFSGEIDFVQTSYVFPTTHMVAPKDNVVACTECHTRENGRMAGIAGVYIPGRDRIGVLHTLGLVIVLGSLAGVCLHGLGRIFASGRKER
ncbi:MAG: tetrathionate reductase family octaheme c-type cytochrome [Desulfobacteraceae bacterium]